MKTPYALRLLILILLLPVLIVALYFDDGSTEETE
jgi:hypothetical protein